MCYYGSIIGPVANRISAGRVLIDGMMYELERNQDRRIHLHSGKNATHLQVWQVAAADTDSATLSIALPDGTCGLPGNRQITATYRIIAPATLELTVRATTDAPTLMNIAQHGYWNLDGSPTWEGHKLQIAADHYLPIDADAVPTGEVADVTGTTMDHRAGRIFQRGTPDYDHNFCLSQQVEKPRDVLWLTGQTGLRMTLATNQPGVQIFDGRNGTPPYHAVAIEAQCWPDAPANPKFPSIRLAPNTTYEQITRFRFDRAE